MSIKGKDRGGTRLVCSAFKNAAACTNNRTFYQHHIEQVVLNDLLLRTQRRGREGAGDPYPAVRRLLQRLR